MVVEEKACWPKRNPAFEVVKAGSPLNLLSFSLDLWFTWICSLGDLVCSVRTLGGTLLCDYQQKLSETRVWVRINT